MLRTILFSILLIMLCGAIPAQTVSGSWYGRADVMVPGSSSNYLTELLIKQKGDEVEGIFGYYFKDSYQSFFVRGSYDNKSRRVDIKNLPLLFYGADTRNGIECPMHFTGILMVSQVSSSLKGNFYTDNKYKYTCPGLSVNMERDSADKSHNMLGASTFSGRKFWAPSEEDYIVSGYSLRTADTSPVVNYTAAVIKPAAEKENDELIAEFGKRNNIYEKDIFITSDSVLLSFYDNGDIDDDTISVFLNRKPVLVRRGLSSRALNIYIGLDSAVEVNELSMFADNLGKFPPNTALMVISDGNKRYEYYLSASLKQNSSVRLRRARR